MRTEFLEKFLKGKFAIKCETKEEFRTLMTSCFDMGYTTNLLGRPIDLDYRYRHWGDFKEHVVLTLNGGKFAFGSSVYCSLKKRKIFTYSDLRLLS